MFYVIYIILTRLQFNKPFEKMALNNNTWSVAGVCSHPYLYAMFPVLSDKHIF